MTFIVAGRRALLRDSTGLLTPAGEVVENVWMRLPTLYPRTKLDDMVVMPDHVHGVIWLTDHEGPRVALGEVVRGWKASSCRQARLITPTFGWQSHYHDRVVRSQGALVQVRRYILKNRLSLGVGRDSSRPDLL